MKCWNPEHTFCKRPLHFPITPSKTQTLTMSVLAMELIRVKGSNQLCNQEPARGNISSNPQSLKRFTHFRKASWTEMSIAEPWANKATHGSRKKKEKKKRGNCTIQPRQVLPACRLPTNPTTRWSPKAEPCSEAHRCCLHSTHQRYAHTLCNTLACHIDA